MEFSENEYPEMFDRYLRRYSAKRMLRLHQALPSSTFFASVSYSEAAREKRTIGNRQ